MLRLQKNRESGKLIVFEGTDGAGKTTLIHKTVEYLSGIYGADRILVQKQPTDLTRKTKLFQKMMYRKNHDDINYRAVQLLTLSDRVQHNLEVILPALREGKIVVCDRYLFTSIANMLARGYKKEKWFYLACREIIRPDLAFLAYVQPEIAIRRIKSRPEESTRYLDEELLKKVAANFMRYRNRFGLKLITTNRNAEDVFLAVKRELNLLLGATKDERYGNELYYEHFTGQTPV